MMYSCSFFQMEISQHNVNAFATMCPRFDTKGTDVYGRWLRWVESFELIAGLAKYEEDKLNWMLAYAGPEVQQILKYAAEADLPLVMAPYTRAIKKLSNHFASKATPFMNEQALLSCKQLKTEAFNEYLVKVQEAAARCDLKEKTDQAVLHQLARGSFYEKVREKCSEVSDLQKAINFALTHENNQAQKKEAQQKLEQDINAIGSNDRGRGKQFKQFKRSSNGNFKARNPKRRECYRCGSWKHIATSTECIAKDVTCDKCKKKGHFARVCGRVPRAPKKVNQLNMDDEVETD